MPYRHDSRPASTTGRRRFAFASARVRLGADRFELSFWDPDPTILLAMSVSIVGSPLLVPWRWAPLAIVAALVLASGPRRALVVDRDGAWLELRFLGVRARRTPLGRAPVVTSGLVWDWSEVAVVPSDVRFRAALHDHERAVLAEWGGDDGKAADGERLAMLANAEIARLHGDAVNR